MEHRIWWRWSPWPLSHQNCSRSGPTRWTVDRRTEILILNSAESCWSTFTKPKAFSLKKFIFVLFRSSIEFGCCIHFFLLTFTSKHLCVTEWHLCNSVTDFTRVVTVARKLRKKKGRIQHLLSVTITGMQSQCCKFPWCFFFYFFFLNSCSCKTDSHWRYTH